MKIIKTGIKPYLFFCAASLLTGGLSALLTAKNMSLYDSVNKPLLSPPAAVFPIVWTILYILMGISAARVYQRRSFNPAAAKRGLQTFAVSLIFNFFWSVFFFNARAYLFSFLWLAALWALVFFTIVFYKKIDKPAGNMQIPYLIWLTFAGYLNLFIYILNR